MAATIKIKNSSTTGAVPTSGDLVQGELAVNVTDTGLYTENASGTVVKLNAPSIDDKNTGATKHLTISTGGNAGLGVTPSAWSGYKAIDITSGGAIFGYATNYAGLASNCYNNGSGWKYKNTATAGLYQLETNTHVWYTAASGTAGNAISFTQAMTLDASGNLGIGNTSPSSYYVDFRNLVVGNGSDNAGITIVTGTARSGTLAFADGTAGGNAYRGYLQYDHSSDVLTIGTNATERARIDSSGRLLVGTTSALNSTANLSVFNTSGGSSGGLSIGYGSGAGANRWIYLISANGSLYFESSANAASLNSAGAWTNASDARLKNSITDIKYGLSAVLSSQPRSYKMNDLEGDYIGFVAQELQNVIPEVVSGDPEKQLGVDYGSLVAVAFKAIQEQQALIASQSEIITQLQADVAALKG